uniref:EIF-4F 25 kDa subunit n=1 Tax=Noctiluca scintillans TaxID=2966 RepID=A0A7S0ZLM9_NOCSC|mmetsp:Transcript_100/g.300  ORF Transcript_100/g.300 Transcript_100/m.300 type:complete len:203 (+) Transcript_100:100-708(+)|eukprot:CAMPEP_0194488800 /NCGR_PEP_ID=MMETSP0253-20130528/8587_1 /TAXON_ID=2966 /ORGANISM="Noctiluca scintillans" /LENGTH=202 /DNA_ID=CAMNT_0039329203 /DNA_START=79 /DNA_END=687 /DNA_ORIENTATION=-
MSQGGTEEAECPSEGHEVAAVHPLENAWSLWVLLRDSSTKGNWQGSQADVASFVSVEEFWGIFNNIQKPSKLGTVDFSVFKRGIRPAWEDETCKRGGRWVARVDWMKPSNLDSLWLHLVLTVIGENFEDAGGSSICGAVVSTRHRNYCKLALWISERAEEKVMLLGHAFCQMLQENNVSCDISFEDFSGGEVSKALFTISGK